MVKQEVKEKPKSNFDLLLDLDDGKFTTVNNKKMVFDSNDAFDISLRYSSSDDSSNDT